MTHPIPDLSFLLPPASENRWTDLLATLISTDPQPISRFIGAMPNKVCREVAVGGSDRLDLLLLENGKQLAAIEVKILSDLGARQLDRYREAFCDAASYHVLHLGLLPVNYRSAPGWTSLTWENVLFAYSTSDHPWVSATAQAWLGLLPELVPQVSAEIAWNDVPEEAAAFELNLRAKVAWLANRMDDWCQLDHYLSMSSGGGAWTATMRTPSRSHGHWALAELQEGLDAREWRPDLNKPYGERLKGPVILVGLSQSGVSTSAGFDWPSLLRAFRNRVIDSSGRIADGRPWQRSSASPRNPIDRANWEAMIANGAPKWLGKGYGMATALTHQVCAFGARLQFPPHITLGQLDIELQGLTSLIIDISKS